jgi:hypothetical protein
MQLASSLSGSYKDEKVKSQIIQILQIPFRFATLWRKAAANAYYYARAKTQFNAPMTAAAAGGCLSPNYDRATAAP